MVMLDPALQAETHFMGQGPLSHVLLKDDCRFSWFLLVPQVKNITEIYELTSAQQQDLMSEITKMSGFIKTHLGVDKLNVAALGNKVSQLHIHVIGRKINDAAWPEPVWGTPGPIPYSPESIDILKNHIQQLFL